jgi:molybdopterin-guanine dinucleotide biosynthesis protein A
VTTRFNVVFDAIVLAGGGAARLDGADKPALDIGGASLLERVLTAVADADRIVVVGPVRPASRPVTWCREEPPGAGPVAALATGVLHVEADVVLTLAADLPWIGSAVPALRAALAGTQADCAALVDGDGRVNYLAAAWRRASLVRALTELGDPAGAAMRSLVSGATMLAVPDEDGWGLDCDTWDDIDGARRRLHREGTAR